jgi:hypothetical protein
MSNVEGDSQLNRLAPRRRRSLPIRVVATSGAVSAVIAGGLVSAIPAASALAAPTSPSIDAVNLVESFLSRLQAVSFADLRETTPGLARYAQSLSPDQAGGWEVPLVSSTNEQVGYAVVTPSDGGGPLQLAALAHGNLDELTANAIQRLDHLSGQPNAVVSTTPLLTDAFDPGIVATLADGSQIDALLNEPQVGDFRESPKPTSSATTKGAFTTTTPSTSAIGASYVPNGEADIQMPYFQWFVGCTPTAAEMIEAWWSRESGLDSLFPLSPDYENAVIDDETNPLANSGSTDADIESMASALGTDSSGGTSPTAIAAGIQTYENDRGVYRSVTTISNPTIGSLKNVVDSVQVPTLGSFIGIYIVFPDSSTTNSLANIISVQEGYGQYYGTPVNHSIAITGYATDPSSGATYMISHDDSRLDGDALFLWNNSWTLGQFNYTPTA